MAISLSPKTQKLIEERMRAEGFDSADELVQHALDTLDQFVFDYDDLDEETRAAIERANAEIERGEPGRPVDDVFADLRKKYFSK